MVDVGRFRRNAARRCHMGVNDPLCSPADLDMGHDRLPTKEEFDRWCQWKVARIFDTLAFHMVKYEVFKALASGEQMPIWVKAGLLEAFRPPPSAVALSHRGANRRSKGPR
jgi:hypothetical protein